MAIKVINPTPDPELVKRISCKSCGARLEYMPIDVLTSKYKDISGCGSGDDYIVCPCCSKWVIIRSW